MVDGPSRLFVYHPESCESVSAKRKRDAATLRRCDESIDILCIYGELSLKQVAQSAVSKNVAGYSPNRCLHIEAVLQLNELPNTPAHHWMIIYQHNRGHGS